MSTSRLADQRIRAAASQVVGLDVHGPVSRALGQIPAPLADAPPGPTAAPGPAETPPARAASRPQTARRVHKPFAEAQWPTRRRAERASEPPATLSGLTADGRRVHRILLDTLAIDNARDGVSAGLSYAEKKRLPTLDLAFIDAEIAKMNERPSLGALRWVLAAALVGVAVPFALAADGSVWETAFFLVLAAVMAASLVLRHTRTSAGPQRLAIYRALRELALLADPDDVTSDALRQSDAIIDRLAGAAPDGVTDHAPRVRLDDPPTHGAPVPGRARARS